MAGTESMETRAEALVALWRPPPSPIAVFARAGLGAIERRLDGCGAAGSIHLTLHPPPGLALVPFRNEPVALVTLRGDPSTLDRARDLLASLPGTLETWRCATAEPQPTEPGPHPCLLTLFRKRADLDEQTFLSRWHGEHTPMAIEIHPSIGYVRHVVVEPLGGSAPWNGIVVEAFRAREDVTTLRLFGRGPRALWNAVRVGMHVRTFLDLRTIETYLVESRELGLTS